MSPDLLEAGTSEETVETPQTWLGQEEGRMMVTELKWRDWPRASLRAGEERSKSS